MLTTEHFARYAPAIVEFHRHLLDSNYSNDRESLGQKLCLMCVELLECWSQHHPSAIKWLDQEAHDLPTIIFLHAFDAEDQCQANIGIHKDGIHIQFTFFDSSRIIDMSDDFWRKWLQLADYGDFDLFESEFFHEEDKNQHPDLFKTKHGTLFQALRAVVAGKLITGFPIEIGNLCVTWPFEKYSIAEVVENGHHVYRIMCELNAMLGEDAKT